MEKEIDKLLKKWGRQNRASPEHLDQLVADISAAASGSTSLDFSQSSTPLLRKLAYFAAGAAAMLLLIASYDAFTSLGNIGANSYASIKPKDLEKSRSLLHEVERIFPEQLRWIAESNGDISLGVESGFEAGGDSAEMLVRLAVVYRDIGCENWTPAWRADVVMRGEEMVEIHPAKKFDNNLALWVYPLVDGKLAVDGEFSLKAPARIVARINRVVKPGETVEIASHKQDGREYRIYQTVSTL